MFDLECKGDDDENMGNKASVEADGTEPYEVTRVIPELINRGERDRGGGAAPLLNGTATRFQLHEQVEEFCIASSVSSNNDSDADESDEDNRQDDR